MKILIADDDPTARQMLGAVSRRWGYEPCVVRDGDEAWAALQEPDAPRLILLDWMMPGMNGPTLCARLRETETLDPPYIIMLTARDATDDLVCGLDAGANDYIAKPYETDELQSRLKVGKRMLGLQEELNEAREALAYQASHDPLTGVFNRRAVLEALSAELCRAARQGSSVAVGLCDLDHFKRVNDTYGHAVGDDVLNAFARIVQSNLRPYDVIGRYGGEEFLLLATEESGAGSEELWERICACVAKELHINEDPKLRVTVSIGVARTGLGGESDDLLLGADKALYVAKAKGRNRVEFSEPFA